MKIHIASTYLHLGGAEIDIRGLAIQLTRDGHEVIVHSMGGKDLDMGYKEAGVTLASRPSGPPECDALIVMGPENNRPAIQGFEGPVINFVANITPGYFSPSLHKEFDIYAHIVDSKNTEDYVKTIDPDARTFFWYHMAHPSILQVEGDRLLHKVDEFKYVVGTLCAHRFVKKVPRLMDAFERANIPNSCFLLAGHGKETVRWSQYAAHKLDGRCHVVGKIAPEDLGKFYGCCDVFMNQYVEFAGGRCLTVSEAAGAGCHIVTNEHGGAKENILVENGVVIPDAEFDDKVPVYLREFFNQDEINPKKLSAQKEYRKRYDSRPDVSAWLEEVVDDYRSQH